MARQLAAPRTELSKYARALSHQDQSEKIGALIGPAAKTSSARRRSGCEIDIEDDAR